jgi:biopolymer transport protein ExbB/TolQ
VVAIPALLMVHLASRSLRKYMQKLNRIEQSVWLDASP